MEELGVLVDKVGTPCEFDFLKDFKVLDMTESIEKTNPLTYHLFNEAIYPKPRHSQNLLHTGGEVPAGLEPRYRENS